MQEHTADATALKFHIWNSDRWKERLSESEGGKRIPDWHMDNPGLRGVLDGERDCA